MNRESQVDTIRARSQEIIGSIKQLDEEQKSFKLNFDKYKEISAQIHKMQTSPEYQTQEYVFVTDKLMQNKIHLEASLPEQNKTIEYYQACIVDKLRGVYVTMSKLILDIYNTELITWKRNQQLAGNGFNFDSRLLESIQSWCDRLTDIIWMNLSQINEMKKLAIEYTQYVGEPKIITQTLYDLHTKFTEAITSLVTNTFIIEKQPPQVMKTNTRFSVKVRLLVGGKLNSFKDPPKVKVTIISEKQAYLLLTEHKIKGDASGEITNNIGTMEFDPTTKQLSVTFRNMQLKKIKRAEKKSSESVVDEKFALLFTSEFKVGNDIDTHVFTLSLPVTVIVHGNQEPHAWATVTWDNAFADPARKPFFVPEKVTWGKLAVALNMKFAKITGRGLSVNDLNYLAEKLFKIPSDDYDSMVLTWSQFCKENLPDRNFTFWDWLFAIMKLAKDYLNTLWVDRTIHGFVRKKQAEEMLSTCPSGTFLLRFSDSELGGISIAWVGAACSEYKPVSMLHPFTAKDFAIRTLPDRLNDLTHLLYLYPEIPKDNAFGKYYTPLNVTDNFYRGGYVKPILITHLPGFPSNMSSIEGDLHSGRDTPHSIFSNPNTPHSIFHPNSSGDVMSMVDGDQNLSFADVNGAENFDMIETAMEMYNEMNYLQ